MGATVKVFGQPGHPYTQMLLESVPQLHRRWGATPDETGGADLELWCPPPRGSRARPIAMAGRRRRSSRSKQTTSSRKVDVAGEELMMTDRAVPDHGKPTT